LPIELAFELADCPFLGLEFPFKLCDFFLLRFHEGVHATGLGVSCVVRTFPWHLDGFGSGWKGKEYEG
jgi:hypothetical protein